jgi:membrane-bound metal-dependent hydrolase YbcI (DUF457 family)
MMGFQHALSGTAAGQAAVPWLEHTYGLTDGQMLLTVAVATGAAMVPDLDQAGSTIGRSLGPVTNVVAQLLGFLAGGHRNGTHSLLGIAGFTGVAALAADAGGWALAVLLWVLLGVAVKAYGIGEAMNPAPRGVLRGLGRAVVNVVMLGVTLLILGSGLDATVPLVAGMALGTSAHVAGDMLTPQKCPFFWLPRWLTKLMRKLGKGGRVAASIARERYGVGLVTTGDRWSSPLVTTALTLLLVAVWLRTSELGVSVVQIALA